MKAPLSCQIVLACDLFALSKSRIRIKKRGRPGHGRALLGPRFPRGRLSLPSGAPRSHGKGPVPWAGVPGTGRVLTPLRSPRGDTFAFPRDSFRWNLHPRAPEPEPWSRGRHVGSRGLTVRRGSAGSQVLNSGPGIPGGKAGNWPCPRRQEGLGLKCHRLPPPLGGSSRPRAVGGGRAPSVRIGSFVSIKAAPVSPRESRAAGPGGCPPPPPPAGGSGTPRRRTCLRGPPLGFGFVAAKRVVGVTSGPLVRGGAPSLVTLQTDGVLTPPSRLLARAAREKHSSCVRCPGGPRACPPRRRRINARLVLSLARWQGHGLLPCHRPRGSVGVLLPTARHHAW